MCPVPFAGTAIWVLRTKGTGHLFFEHQERKQSPMPPMRLVGLFLFVTSIFLFLMAVATKTSHIDVKRPDRVVAAEQQQSQASGDAATEKPALQFVSVPIVYPLAVVAVLGLLLWYIPALTFQRSTPRPRRKSRRRRSSAGSKSRTSLAR